MFWLAEAYGVKLDPTKSAELAAIWADRALRIHAPAALRAAAPLFAAIPALASWSETLEGEAKKLEALPAGDAGDAAGDAGDAAGDAWAAAGDAWAAARDAGAAAGDAWAAAGDAWAAESVLQCSDLRRAFPDLTW
jgi:hypothetical protein